MKTFFKKNRLSSFLLSLIFVFVFSGMYSCKDDDPIEPEIKYYDVTLIRNNGLADTIVKVAEGNKMKKPTDPKKADSSTGDSYTFDNWYDNSGFTGNPFDFDKTPITSNKSLYAKYLVAYKVTINTLKMDSSADSTFVLKVAEGETVPFLTIPLPRKDAENQFFKGWYDAKTGGTEYTDATPITKSLNIYYQMETTNYATYDVDATNRTLTIGGYTAASPDKITNVVNFAPPAKIGVYKVKQIGRDMFYPEDNGSNNNTLSTVVIPEGVEEIIGQVFRNCSALKSVSLPSTLKKIEGATFWGTASLSTLVIPEGITYLSTNCFVATGMTSITLPKSITEIQNAAFAHASKLTSINIPDNVKWIGENAFIANVSLTSLNFNVETSKLDSISNGAFAECHSLSTIKFPNSLRVIGGNGARNIFINNLNLATVTIPANVKRIGGGAFALCDKLEEVIFLGNTPPFIEDAVFNKREGTPWVTIKVPAAALQTYKDATQPPYTYGEEWKLWDTCCGQIIANN